MTFGEFVLWLGTSAALGVVSSVLLTLVKWAIPSVTDNIAKIASGLLAGLVCGLAVLVKPYLANLPAWVEVYWPIVVWVAGQIWYILTKPKE